MKNTWLRNLIKIWIVVTSAAAFLVGWILLGHSGKPVQAGALGQPAQQLAPLPTLAPLPDLSSGTGLQPMQQQPSFNFSPRLFTRGS